MASPVRTLRASLVTLFTGAITFTKSTGAATVKYFERDPQHRPFFPYIKYSNCFNNQNDAKACNGWQPLLRLDIVTGATVGHNSPDYADEIAEQVTALMKDKPYVLSLANFAVISSNLEAEQQIEEYTDLAIGRQPKKPYHIIRKIMDYRIKLQEV